MPLVLLLGVGALVVRPSAGTALWWVLAVLLLVALDLLLAASPSSLEVTRRPVAQVRQGETTPAYLVVLNTGRRRLRGVLRDAWQPSAGAGANRHRVDLAAGDQVRLTTPLTPSRRGDRQAGRITVRSIGPPSRHNDQPRATSTATTSGTRSGTRPASSESSAGS